MSIFKCKIAEKKTPSNYIIYRMDSTIYTKLSKLSKNEKCPFTIRALSIINDKYNKINYNQFIEWLYNNKLIKSKDKFLSFLGVNDDKN